jgi:hypothetical protein
MGPSVSEIAAKEWQPISVPYAIRRQVQRRLQELSITAWCCTDGKLRVEVNSVLAAVQVRSTVLQFQASRRELLTWLEHCYTV